MLRIKKYLLRMPRKCYQTNIYVKSYKKVEYGLRS